MATGSGSAAELIRNQTQPRNTVADAGVRKILFIVEKLNCI
jgi:hypothetical protein